METAIAPIDTTKEFVGYGALEQQYGKKFIMALAASTGDRVEIPYDPVTQYGEAIAAKTSFDFLRLFTSTKILGAKVHAFRYQTAEGKESDILLFTHELRVMEWGEDYFTVVYLFDPIDRNGPLFTAQDVLIINNKGEVKKVSELTRGRKMIVSCAPDNSKNVCEVTAGEFRFGLLGLDSEKTAASLFHESGHILRELDPNTHDEEVDSVNSRKNLFIYNFPAMEDGDIQRALTQHPNLPTDLELLVKSEIGAWKKGENLKNEWVRDGFGICGQQAYEARRQYALGTYQRSYQRLFDRVSDIPPFTASLN